MNRGRCHPDRQCRQYRQAARAAAASASRSGRFPRCLLRETWARVWRPPQPQPRPLSSSNSSSFRSSTSGRHAQDPPPPLRSAPRVPLPPPIAIPPSRHFGCRKALRGPWPSRCRAPAIAQAWHPCPCRRGLLLDLSSPSVLRLCFGLHFAVLPLRVLPSCHSVRSVCTCCQCALCCRARECGWFECAPSSVAAG